MLTMYYGEEDIFQAFQAGAMAYLLKDAVADDLVQVLRAVREAEGGSARHPGGARGPRQPAGVDHARAAMLELLATGKRNKEIAAVLGMSSDTASAHVKNIFQKFKVHDRTAAMAEALRRGIIHINQAGRTPR